MNLDWGHGRLDPPDVPADPAVPGRETFTDLAAVGALLGVHPPERIENVWYLPGRGLQVVYGWTAEGTAPALVRSSAADPEPATWRLPDEPRLRAVRDVVGPWSPRWRLLSWLPGVRVTLVDERRAEVVKVSDPAVAERSTAAARSLWSASSARGGFRVPEPRPGCLPRGERREAWVPGRTADLTQEPVLEQAARSVAALHTSTVPGIDASDPHRALRLVDTVTARLEAALPQHADAARSLSQALSSGRPGSSPGGAATLHGDLHPANLLLDHEGIVLLDLDEPRRGDPADDLALLAGRLLLVALVRDDDPGPALTAAAALPELYAAAPGGRRVPASTYTWYLAAHLAGRHTRTCVRHWAPGVDRLVPALLTAAEATLRSSTPTLA